jgi:ABC-type polysaccharide/polyol phosphate transport system ATPase subunit
MSSEIAIKVENLSKCYHLYDKPRDRLMQMLVRGSKQYFREFWALKDVSFEIKKGETVGIIGRNGSGKSTLLQMLCGTLNPSAGAIYTQGRIAALLELGSGFNPEFTGRENVYLNGAIHGLSSSEIDAVFDDVASFADIGKFLDQPVKTYSSGMYARLAFSAAIFVSPDIFVVDEILAVGDAPFQAKCIKAFHKLRDRGTAILLVSHDTYMIRNFCQRALYLRRGNFVDFGDSSTVIGKYNEEVEIALANSGRDEHKDTMMLDDSLEPDRSGDLTQFGVFRVTEVRLLRNDDELCCIVKTGDSVHVEFDYQSTNSAPPNVTFVINLYRHDGLYIFGTTTLMDGMPAVSPGHSGTVSVKFPNLRLLAGRYVWRVAINDERAFGVYAEANQICPFQVQDDLQAVGMFNIERHWEFRLDEQGAI